MLAATLCVDLATAGFNSYYDHRHGVDTRETDVDGYKVLVHRAIDPRIALRVAFGLFLLAAAFGLALGARVGWEVVGVGVVCMLIAWSYSGGPWPLVAPAGRRGVRGRRDGSRADGAVRLRADRRRRRADGGGSDFRPRS